MSTFVESTALPTSDERGEAARILNNAKSSSPGRHRRAGSATSPLVRRTPSAVAQDGVQDSKSPTEVKKSKAHRPVPKTPATGSLSKTYPLPLDAEGNKIVNPAQLPTMLCLRKRQAVVVATAKKLREAPPMDVDIRRQVLMRNTLKANAMRIEQVVEEQTKGKMLEVNADREPARMSSLSRPGQRMSAMQRARLLAAQRARVAPSANSTSSISSAG